MGRGINGRRGRRKKPGAFELQLTSMMDVLVIIVVFLLKSYNTSLSSMTTGPGIQLPVSASSENPTDSALIIITPESMTVENQRILDFVQSASNVGNSDPSYEIAQTNLDQNGRRVIPLYDSLVKARENTEILLAKSSARGADGKPLPFPGILSVQADKKIKYEIIRKVMYTAGDAGYKTVRFIAMQKET